MTPRVIRPTRLQDRIVVFFVVLLMAVQLVSFYFIRYAIEHTAQGTMREELRVGARVFKRLLGRDAAQPLVIDDATARDLKRQILADVTFVPSTRGEPRILATTLTPARRAELLAPANRIIDTQRDGVTFRLGEDDYEGLATSLGG